MKRQFIFKTNKETAGKFKSKCFLNNQTMSQVIESFMTHYIEHNELGMTIKIVEIEKKVEQDLRLVINLDTTASNLPLKQYLDIDGYKMYTHEDRYFINVKGAFREIELSDVRRWKDFKPKKFIDLFLKRLDSVES